MDELLGPATLTVIGMLLVLAGGLATGFRAGRAYERCKR